MVFGGESCDHFAQCEQRLVYLDWLFSQDLVGYLRVLLTLAPCKVHDLQLGHNWTAILSDALYLNGEQGVRPAAAQVEFVAAHSFVLNSEVVKQQNVLESRALNLQQIIHLVNVPHSPP